MKRKNYKKPRYVKKSKAVVASLLAILLIGGAVGTAGALTKGFTDWNITDNNKKVDEETEIIEEGVSIKKLNTIENDDGSIVKTFTYSVSPSNATNQAITISTKFADGTDCSSYLDSSVDLTTKTVTLKTKKVDGSYGWNQKINVTLQSVVNSSAKANINLDYLKKIESLEFLTYDETNALLFDFNYNFDDTLLDFSRNLDISYSRFTIDKKYTFKFENLVISPDEFISENFYNSDLDVSTINSYIHSVTDFTSSSEVMNFISSRILQSNDISKVSLFTPDEFWNLTDDNKVHFYLNYVSNFGNYDNFDYQLYYLSGIEIICNDDPSISVRMDNFDFELNLFINFNRASVYSDTAKYPLSVDSISSEITDLTF